MFRDCDGTTLMTESSFGGGKEEMSLEGQSCDQQINRNREHTVTPVVLGLLIYNALQLIKYLLEGDYYEVIKSWADIEGSNICTPLPPSNPSNTLPSRYVW